MELPQPLLARREGTNTKKQLYVYAGTGVIILAIGMVGGFPAAAFATAMAVGFGLIAKGIDA